MPKWPLEKVLQKIKDLEDGVLRVDLSSPRVQAAIEQGRRIAAAEMAAGLPMGTLKRGTRPPLPECCRAEAKRQASESDSPPPETSRPDPQE